MTQKEYRKLLKQNHICRNCKKQDAYTLNGRTYCAECAEKNAEQKRNARKKDGGEKDRIACRKHQEKNRKEHKCVYCGRKLQEDYNYKTCVYCRAKNRKYLEQRRREAGMISWDMRCSSDICFQCGKNPPIEGKRLCKECYEKKVQTCMPIFEKMAWKGREILRSKNKLYQSKE